MCGVGAAGGRKFEKAGDILKNAAKNVGTGPTPIEKKLGDAAVDGIKRAADTVSDFVTSVEGSAITAGVIMKTAAPFSPLGDAFILGGIGISALKYLENHGSPELTKNLSRDLLLGTAGIVITPVAPLAGGLIMGGAALDAAFNVGHAIGTAAVEAIEDSAKKAAAAAAKEIVKGAVEGAAKAVENVKKPKVQ